MTALYELNIESLNSSVNQEDYDFAEELVRTIGSARDHRYSITSEQKLLETIRLIKERSRYKGVTEYGATWCLFTVPSNFQQSRLFVNCVESVINEKIRWCAITFKENDPCGTLMYLSTEQYVVFTHCGDFTDANGAEYWLDQDEDGNLHFTRAAQLYITTDPGRHKNIEDVAFWMAWLAVDEQIGDRLTAEKMTTVVQTRANMYLKVLKMFWSNLSSGCDLSWVGVESIVGDKIKDWQP